MNRESQQKEIIKKNQIGILELKSTITAMKNSLEGLNSRSELADNRINKSEDRSTKFSILKNIQENNNNKIVSETRETPPSIPTQVKRESHNETKKNK